ncbi:phage holin family protein [Bacillus sp. NEB1478]|uniref:phage holin family protein n=1 Tax=Bacillus sp. NEB1478 TaxID=3073816 RepID=UPI002872D846|nr:phage holin family protein [Bacillus sp. NEB1478]WNB90800.1 phage holin family protein [Bacillus sp. NEB1478]
MEKISMFYNMAVIALGAISSYLFGTSSLLFKTLVLFVVLDYLTGMASSAYEGKLNSKIGFKGILKKVMIFAIVAIAHSLDQLTGGNIIKTATIFFYLSNELLSMIENAGRLNVPIPPFIKNAVSLLRQKSGNQNKDD